MLSKKYMHLYFPIDWNNANSRGVAYHVGCSHESIVNTIRTNNLEHWKEMITHETQNGKTFSVEVLKMKRINWVLLLLMRKNPSKLKIIDQLQRGVPLNNVEL